MVLDEDALEAMLKRQPPKPDADDAKESKQTELTQQTEEFEVYERPGEPATGAGINAPEPTPEPVIPEAFQESEPVIEEAPEPVPEPALEPIAEPVAEVAVAEPAVEEAEPEPVVEEEPEPQRPRVWPPIGGIRETAPEATPEPQLEPVAEEAPAPAPEPVVAVEPEPAPTQQSADPHSHAHAKLAVDGGGVRVAIVQALFNQDITDMMADLAVAKAKKRGAEVTHHVTVPGVYDLPLITARLLERDDVDCAVVIGVVVQGETKHDDVITHATARTLQQLSLDVDKPIGLGITGPGMTWAQAEARVANGAHALDAALAQVELTKSIR